MSRPSAKQAVWGFVLCLPLSLLAGDQAFEANPRRIWHGDGVNLWGAPTPDGQWVSFVEASTGAVTLRNVNNDSERHLAGSSGKNAGEFAYFSVFDRSGERVAYAWFNSEGYYELRVAAAALGQTVANGPQVLFSNPEVPFVQPCAWSHDGERILALFFREDNTSQIALVNVDDGTVRVLRSLHWIYPKRMDLSPDGRYLVYDNLAEREGFERDLYLLRTDGSEERRLLAGPADDQSPVWSHDGGKIWFVSDRGGDQAIWSVSVGDGASNGPPRRLTGPLERVLLMGATRSGEVFYGQRKGAVRLYLQQWDKVASAPVSDPVPMPAETLEPDRQLPVFSPDGEHLAFLARIGTENQGREHRAVVLQSLRNGSSAAVPTRLTFVRSMRFSPDGRLLLLSGSDRRGRSGLFLHDRRSERTRPVELAESNSVEGIPGTFGRSGDTVLLAVADSSQEGFAVVERRLDGDAPQRRIAALPWGKRLVAIAAARDGGRVALAWKGDDSSLSSTLAVVDARGGRPKPILALPSGDLTGLTWAPGDSDLLVGTRGSGGARLWLVSASGQSMTEVPSPTDRLPGLSFSPDGTRLAYAAGRTSEEVWVLEHGTKPQR